MSPRKIVQLNSKWPPLGEPCTRIQYKMDLGWGRDQELQGCPSLRSLAILLSGEEGQGYHLWVYCLSSNPCDETARPPGALKKHPGHTDHHLWRPTAQAKPGCWDVWSEEREGGWERVDSCVLNCASSFTPPCKSPAEGPVHGTSRIRRQNSFWDTFTNQPKFLVDSEIHLLWLTLRSERR